MISIDKSLWFQNQFAEVLTLADVLRQPEESYESLKDRASEAFRQTQVLPGDVVQVLAHYQNYNLIRKQDKTLGWIRSANLKATELKEFPSLAIQTISAAEFLPPWLGTIYYWGGLSQKGIDCSGFSQLYYLHVLGRLLPKNSKDQRKLGKEISKSELRDHDLVFCHPLSEPSFHHVVIHYDSKLWHSSRKFGVVCHSWEEFERNYGAEAYVSYSMSAFNS